MITPPPPSLCVSVLQCLLLQRAIGPLVREVTSHVHGIKNTDGHSRFELTSLFPKEKLGLGSTPSVLIIINPYRHKTNTTNTSYKSMRKIHCFDIHVHFSFFCWMLTCIYSNYLIISLCMMLRLPVITYTPAHSSFGGCSWRRNNVFVL